MPTPPELHRLESLAERQEALRKYSESLEDRPKDGVVFDFGAVDPAVYAPGCESLAGAVALPVGVVGPLRVETRRYQEDETGELVEVGTEVGDYPIPMATHEGGLNASLNRGIQAANACGGVRTFLIKASMTRGTCYVFETTEEAYLLSRWLGANAAKMRAWLDDPANPLREVEVRGAAVLSRHARLRSIETYVVGTTCHAVFEFSTGDACGQNMSTRNAYLLHQHYVLPRFEAETGFVPTHFLLEANTGGDKKVSHLYHSRGGHGRTVVASVVVSEEVLERRLKASVEDTLRIRRVGAEGCEIAGMVGAAANPSNAIAAIFAATGQDLACVGTSSMAITSCAPTPGGLVLSLRLPNLEVGTVGGGTGLPHQHEYLQLMRCTGDGSANRFAQVVTAATLCLELSTGCAMAAAGSVNFYNAHLERGGSKRRAPAERETGQ
jgi:hydroxymethylglutaryl-CoA reductase (NADPH)